MLRGDKKFKKMVTTPTTKSKKKIAKDKEFPELRNFTDKRSGNIVCF